MEYNPTHKRELRYIDTGVVVTEDEYKANYPYTSFSTAWSPEDAEWVKYVPPVTTNRFQVAVRDGEELTEDGWEVKWRLVQNVPAEVTMRQARIALLKGGHLSKVTELIETLPENERDEAKIEWEYSQVVQRNQRIVLFMGPALELTDQQVDELFIYASTL